MIKKKQILTPEQKERKKITNARWYQENSEKHKATVVKYCENNPDYKKEQNHKHDLGYFVVYVIRNFNNLENDYVGQTGNVYRRMADHKCKGKLNTETHEILEKFDCRLEALGFELTMHLNGYHGNNY